MYQHLVAAILKQDKFAIEDFLKAGADPNARIPSEEFAPIHLGAGTSKSVTQLLLRYGADPNARTSEGSTPLHIAASWGKSGVLKLLLKYGADMSIKDNEELDALGVAGKYESEKCIVILQNHERKHEIDIQSKKHSYSNAYKQIEINVYINRVKLFSTFINSDVNIFQYPDQNFQFDENGPINVNIMKGGACECGLEQSDNENVTLSESSSLKSLPVREELSTNDPHEKVLKYRNNKEESLLGDHRLDTKITQESSVHKNQYTKIEYPLIDNEPEKNKFQTDPIISESDQCWKDTIEISPTEAQFYPFPTSQHDQEMHNSENNFHRKQHLISSSGFNDIHDEATQDESAETVYVDTGSPQTLIQSHTGHHLDLGSETDHNKSNRIYPQFSGGEIKEEPFEQWNEHSKYLSQNMTKDIPEKSKSSLLERKMAKSLSSKSSILPYSCNTYTIKTNPFCQLGKRTCPKGRNEEFCTVRDENIQPSRSYETACDFKYIDNTTQTVNCKCAYCVKQTDLKDEIYTRSFKSYTETSDLTAKPKRFMKYHNNPCLKFAAVSENNRKGLPTEKLSMKNMLRKLSSCPFCRATKAMFVRLKRKIIL